MSVLLKTQAALLTVAAANSQFKDKANYVCDGIADQVEINIAINTLPNGGTVKLLEGTFYINDSIVPMSNISLEGCGPGTVIYLIDALPDPGVDWGMIETLGVAKTNIRIANLTLDGNRIAQGAFALHGFYFTSVSYWGVKNVLFKNIRAHALKPYNANPYGDVIGNTFLDSGLAMYLDNGSDHVTFTANVLRRLRYGVLVDSCSDVVIADNVIDMSGSAGYDGPGIEISRGSTRVAITGNSLEGPAASIHGIFLNAQAANLMTITVRKNIVQGFVYGIVVNAGVGFESSYHSICDNTVTRNREHGICLLGGGNGTHHNLIQGNYCLENSQDANDSKDNIYLAGDADYNHIVSNICRRGVTANTPRYGINISAVTCGDNLITENDLYDAGVTGSFYDAGIRTIAVNNKGAHPYTFNIGEVLLVNSYLMGLPAQLATTFNPTTGFLFANLVWVPRKITVDRLAFWITIAAAAGGEARLGIHLVTSWTNLSPGALLLDGGVIATDVLNLREVILGAAITLDRGWYWFDITHNNVAPVATCRCVYAAWSPLGTHSDAPFSATHFIDHAYANHVYGALPNPFPAAGFGYYYRRGNLVAPRVASLVND